MSDISDDEYQSGEEESEENDIFDGKKNVTIILIDVGSSMFDTPRIFKTCLLAIYQVMDQMLIKAYKRNISVCLLRDEDIVLTELNGNLIESTKKIYDLLQTSIETLRTKFERKNPSSLRYTLTECIKQFFNLEKVNPYIVILTNDEDPIKGNQNEKLSAIDVALSFKELNVKLVVLPLKEKFDYSLFYKELIKSANDAPLEIFQDDDDEQSYTSVDKLTDILACVIKDKVSIRRHKFRFYKHKGMKKEAYFWIQMRYLLNNSHLYKNSIISRSNNNNLRQGYKEENNLNMEKMIIDEPICIPLTYPKNDYVFVKMPYGFRLLHVAKEKQGSVHYLFKKGFLLQFDETNEKKTGLNIFNNMWEFCKNKNRYLICAFNSPGNKQHPNIVELSADTFQGQPCFIGQFLANSDVIVEDKEEYEEEPEFKKNDPELGLVFDMIDKLKLKKYPYNWNDYSYDLKAANIKAQFLDTEPDSVEAYLPTEEDITQQLGDTNVELQEIFGFTVDPPATKRSRKH